MKKLITFFLFLIINISLFAQTEVFKKSIYFGGGSAYIDAEQIEELNKLINSIPNLERYQISITSHTDNIGGKEYNEWLSKMRSEAVVDELINGNVPPEQVYIKDYGQENPLYNNNTHEGRIMNRRVDIIFSPLNL